MDLDRRLKCDGIKGGIEFGKWEMLSEVCGLDFLGRVVELGFLRFKLHLTEGFG